jgi:hypothetical protein
VNAADLAAEAKAAARALHARRLLARWYRGTDAVEAIPRPPALVEGIIATGSLAMLVGRWKTFKSFLALDLALSVAAGVPWCGRSTTGGRVVYLLGEGAGDIGERVQAWRTYHGMHHVGRFELVAATVNLLDDDDIQSVLGILDDDEHPTVLIVVDTLARSMAGGDENGRDMSRAIDACGRIIERTGAAVLLVHHYGKNAEAGARGHSSLPGAVDAELTTERAADLVTIRHSLSKYYPEAEPITMRAVPHGGTLVAVHQPGAGGDSALTDSAAMVLRVMRDTMSGSASAVSPSRLLDWVTEAALVSGSRPVSDRTLRRALRALEASGQVRVGGSAARPLYSLSEADSGHEPDTP